jgi:hypothetical protein
LDADRGRVVTGLSLGFGGVENSILQRACRWVTFKLPLKDGRSA